MAKDIKVRTGVEEVTIIDTSEEIVKIKLIEAKVDVVQIKSLSDTLFGYRAKEASREEVIEIISRIHLIAHQLTKNCSDILMATSEKTEVSEEDLHSYDENTEIFYTGTNPFGLYVGGRVNSENYGEVNE